MFRRVPEGPNLFEQNSSSFSIDTTGNGSRRFDGASELHRLIGEGKYDEIMEKSYWLTETALKTTCRYDAWNGVSPLWMVVAWRCGTRGGKWDKMVRLMVEKGASINNCPDHSFGRSTSVMGQAVKNCSYEIIEYLLKAGASPNGGSWKPLAIAKNERNDDIGRLLESYGAQ